MPRAGAGADPLQERDARGGRRADLPAERARAGGVRLSPHDHDRARHAGRGEPLRAARHRRPASLLRRPYRRGAGRRRGRVDAAAVRRRDRRRRALRPRRGRHEGRDRLLPRRGARLSEGQWRPAARLAVVPDHRRRGVGRHQRHAQAAGLAEGARRDARCLPGRRAGQREAVGDQIKIGRRGYVNARLIVHGKQGHSAYGERAENPIPKLARIIDRLSSTPLDAGTRALPALEPAGHHRLGAEHGHQRHPGLGARQLQHPLQRPAHTGPHRGLGEGALRGGGQGGRRPLLAVASRAPATCS